MFYSLFLDLSSLVSFCLPIRARARLFGFFSCPMLKRDSPAKETMQIKFFRFVRKFARRRPQAKKVSVSTKGFCDCRHFKSLPYFCVLCALAASVSWFMIIAE